MHGGTPGDGRGRSCPRRVPAGGRGDRVPALRRRGAGRMGSCPRSMDRWVGGFASSAAGSARPLSGDARVAAGDGAAAQSVCGGANLGCVGGARRRVRASTDRCWNPGAGGDGARLAAPRGRSAGGAAGVVCRCGGFAANRFSGWSTVSSCRGWPCWSRLPWSSSPRPVSRPVQARPGPGPVPERIPLRADRAVTAAWSCPAVIGVGSVPHAGSVSVRRRARQAQQLA